MKVSKRFPKRVSRQDNVSVLTAVENEVLYLLTKNFLTTKQVAIRRRCSRQAVNKIIRKLKQKGALNPVNKEVSEIRPTWKPCNQIRLHAQEFNIKILFKDNRYKKLLAKANTINIDGNTIRLYRDSIEIYSGKSFYSDTVQKSTVKSFQYWNKLFSRLENDLNLILVKSRYQNIKLVNMHYAETNNEISRDYEVSGDKIRAYTTNDGKLWFTIDNSFNLHEAETQHPITAKQDMEKLAKVFNQYRDGKALDPETMSNFLAMTMELQKDISQNMLHMSQTLKILFPKQKKKLQKDNSKDVKPDYLG